MSPRMAFAELYVDESAVIALTTGPGEYRWPDIDGSNAVWFEHHDNQFTMYAKDLANMVQPARPIVTGTIAEPEIDGSRVVYYDYSEGHVYLVDIAEANPQPIRLSTLPTEGNPLPSISGDRVIWTRKVGDDSSGEPYELDIYGIDLTNMGAGDYWITGSVHNDVNNFLAGHLSGDMLAYTDTHGIFYDPFDTDQYVFVKDVSAPSLPAITLDGVSLLGYVDIEDNWVVWGRVDQTYQPSLVQESNLYVADLTQPSMGPRELTVGPYDVQLADLSGSIALYREFDSILGYSAIYAIDVTDPNTTPFPVVETGSLVGRDQVKLSGNTVIYAQDGDIFVNYIVPEPASLLSFLTCLSWISIGRFR